MNDPMEKKNVVIFGGTGFVGRKIAHHAYEAGYQPVIVTRNPKPAEHGVHAPHFTYKICDYHRPDNLPAVLEGAYAAINCVGILYETKAETFDKVHLQLAHTLAKAAHRAGVKKFVHISSLGVYAPSRYGLSKKQAEMAVRGQFPAAVILRPSVIFGEEDNFFNMFKRLSTFLPILPLLGRGKTKLQPVYVGDVAQAAIATLTTPAAEGQIYELGGAEVLTFKQIYERLFQHTKKPRLLLPLPWGVSYVQGWLFGLLPKPLLTVDQVKSLTVDSIVAQNAKTLRDLGLQPTPLDPILAQYLR